MIMCKLDPSLAPVQHPNCWTQSLMVLSAECLGKFTLKS